MALTPKDREKIIEEETLRFETRIKLQQENTHGGHCGGYKRCNWFKWILIGILILFIGKMWCHNYGPCSHGKMSCPFSGEMMQNSQDNGTANTPATAPKK